MEPLKLVESQSCNGTANTDTTVCSSHGFCVSEDYCICHPGYRGTFCDEEQLGYAFSAGWNSKGQLGDTFTVNRQTTIRIPGWFSLLSLAAVSAGEGYSMALTTSGDVYTWGDNSYGQLGTGDSASRLEPTLVLKGAFIKVIAACAVHSIALAKNGSIYTWGTNKIITPIDTDNDHAGILGHGTFDAYAALRPTIISASLPTNFISVGCGRYHSLALTTAGGLYVWGSNLVNQLGDGGTGTNLAIPTPSDSRYVVSSFAAGEYHSLISTIEGKVYSWGLGTSGQSGVVDSMGNPMAAPATPRLVSGSLVGKFVVSVTSGRFSSLARCLDGSVHVWGKNTDYQLGDGTTTQRNVPVQLTDMSWVTNLFGGSLTDTIFATVNHTGLYAWGKNSYGIYGTGVTGVIYRVPTAIPDLYSGAYATQVAPGSDHALFLISGITCFAIMAGDENVCASHGTCVAMDQCQCHTGFTGLDCSLPFCFLKNSSDETVCNGHGQCLTTDTCVCYHGFSGDECEEAISGVMYGSGDDSEGQLGDTNSGAGLYQYATIVSNGFFKKSITMLDAGYKSSLAISGGKLYGVGWNYLGKLGSGAATKPSPIIIDNGSLSGKIVVAACSGYDFSLALAIDGTLHALGGNSQGQLGTGVTTASTTPIQVGGLLPYEQVVQVSCGYQHAAALTLNGTVFTWGSNSNGQIGNGKSGVNVLLPYQVYISGVLYTRRVSMVVCGHSHTMALVSDGNVYTWGAGSYGQLGFGSFPAAQVLPVKIIDGITSTKIISISASSFASYAVGSDGIGYAWGKGSQGQIGNGEWVNKNIPTKISITPSEPIKFISSGVGQVVGEDSHAIAITVNGTAWTWGQNTYGQLSDGTANPASIPVRYNSMYPYRRVVSVSAGFSHTLITYNATDSCYGVYMDEPHTCSYHGDCIGLDTCNCHANYTGDDCSIFKCFDLIFNASTVCHSRGKCIAHDTCVCQNGYTGDECEFERFGVVYAVGKQDANFQLGDDDLVPASIAVPTTGLLMDTFVTTVEAGKDYSIVLGRNGYVYTWGSNSFSVIGDGTSIVRRKPYIAFTGNAISICSGGYHSLVVNSDGKAYSWGSTRTYNAFTVSCGNGWTTEVQCNYGVLGRGAIGVSILPTPDLVSAPTDQHFTQAACGLGHSVLVTDDGKIWTFGLNYMYYGSPGYSGVGAGYIGPSASSGYVLTPYNVLGRLKFNKIIQVAAGDFHTLALGSHGEVYSWGRNTVGQLGDGTSVSKATPILVSKVIGKLTVVFVAAGKQSSYAITSTGDVYSWGQNTLGQLGDGTTVNRFLPVLLTSFKNVNIVHISASKLTNYVLAVAKNGSAYGWGDNTQSQIGDETTTNTLYPVSVVNRSKVRKIVHAATSEFHSLFLYNGTFCFGKLSDDPYVCHGRGNCSDTDACQCKEGYLGSECEISMCFGLNSTDDSVCSGHGYCVGYNSCSCINTHTGAQCELEVFGLSFSMGSNAKYQLGDDYYDDRAFHVQTSYPLSNVNLVRLVHAGNRASLAISKVGKLYTWGNGDYAQIGDGTFGINRNRPTPILTSKTFRSACMGNTYGVAVDESGQVWAWGYSIMSTNPLPYIACYVNGYPQYCPNTGLTCGCVVNPEKTGVLGNPSHYYYQTPVQVLGLPSISSVACGVHHVVALAENGTVWSWGRNDNAQLGYVPSKEIRAPMQIGNVISQGGVLGNIKLISVAAGQYHSLALGEHGEVYVWGYNNVGQIGDNSLVTKYNPRQVMRTILAEPITTIAAGWGSSYALSSSGKLFSWGSNTGGLLGVSSTVPNVNVPVSVDSVSDITGISVSLDASYALLVTLNGTAYGMGSNNGFLLGDGSTSAKNYPSPVHNSFDSRRVVGVAAGLDHSLYLFNDTYCFGVLADDSLVCSSHGYCLDTDDCICEAGYTSLNCSVPVCFNITAQDPNVCNAHGQCHVPNICQCNPGYVGQECQYQDQRFLFSSGENTHSQLGDGFFVERNIPKQSSILAKKLFHFMSAGAGYSFAVNFHSGAYAWGLNDVGQLGDGSITNRYFPTPVLKNIDVVSLKTCQYHSLALDSSGVVWSWGSNSNGQLGVGNLVNSLTPVQVQGFTNITIKAIACGLYHSMALSTSGAVYTWGRSNEGQLGNGNTATPLTTPFRITHNFNILRITSIAAGNYHSLALSEDGSIFAWGANSMGNLGDGKVIDRVVPFKLTSLYGYPLQQKSILSVQASSDASYVLLSDNTIYSWGKNSQGQLGLGSVVHQLFPTAVPLSLDYSIQTMSASYSGNFIVVLMSNGTAYAWGDNSKGQLGDGSFTNKQSPTIVQNSIPQRYITEVSSGSTHTLYLYAGTACFGILFDDPTVCSWHGNCTAQDTCECEKSYGGRDCSVALCYGKNATDPDACSSHGRCISLDTCVCHQGFSGKNCEVSGYGYLFASGDDRSSQLGNRNIGIQSSILQSRLFIGKVFNFIVAAYSYTLAKALDGTIYAFGDNKYGQLGDGTFNNTRSLPVQILTGENIVGMCGGYSHAMALDDTGRVFAWGSNMFGQIGNNGTLAHNIYLHPTRVMLDVEIVAISCGMHHSLALSWNGTVYTWGINTNGELGDNSLINKNIPVQVGSLLEDKRIVSISSGASHSMALGSDGTVYTWGLNSRGQLGDTTLTSKIIPVQVSGLIYGKPIISISAGEHFSSALSFDYRVYTWGANDAGQLGDLTYVDRKQPVLASGLPDDAEVVSISAGGRYMISMTANSSVFSWGNNMFGQLGDGLFNISKVSSPVQAVNQYEYTYVTSIEAGYTHSTYLHNGITCFGKFVEDPTVCSTKGNCTAHDYCVCEPYYNALDCSTFYCFGFNATDEGVCSGHGFCVAADSCVCKPGFNGIRCENKISGYVFGIGDNSNGQLGDSYTIPQVDPTEVTGALQGVRTVFIAAGIDFTLAVTINGEIYGWGLNNFGQLGDGTTLTRYRPSLVNNLTTQITTVCAGSKHSAAVDVYGRVFTWGANSRGQLGNGKVSIGATTVPHLVRGIIENQTIVSVVCGEEFTLVLNNLGEIYGFGDNAVGQLGDGSNAVQTLPVRTGIGMIDNIPMAAIYAGYKHALAIGPFGVLYAWGDNSAAQLGDGTTFGKYSPIPILTGPLRGKIIISAAGSKENSYVATIDGSLFSWGGNFFGEIGDNSSNIQYKATPTNIQTGTKSIRDLFGGQSNAFALSVNGTAYSWGINSYGQLGSRTKVQQNSPATVVNHYTDRVISLIAAGNLHTTFLYNATACFGFLADDDNVCSSRGVCVDNDRCECFQGFQSYDCSVVVCNGRNSTDPMICSGNGICIPNDTCICQDMWTGIDCETVPFGYLFAAGRDQDGQLGDGRRADSRQMVKSRTISIDRKPFRYISGGLSFSIGILNDEEIRSFGSNDQGQLGDGTTSTAINPVLLQLPSKQSLKTIGIGSNFVIAVDTNNTIYGWGSNANGQLALGFAGEFRSTPHVIPALQGFHFVHISCSINHCLGSTSDGQTISWGSNNFGQLGDGTLSSTKTSYLPYRVLSILAIKKSAMVFAGYYHSMALSIDGIVYSWGDNTRGQLGNNVTSTTPRLLPSIVLGLSNELVIYVTGGEYFSCALCKSGRVYCWGNNADGQLGDGTTNTRTLPTLVSSLYSENITLIRAGRSFVLAQTSSGLVYSWGSNSNGQLALGSSSNRILTPMIVGNYSNRYSEFIGTGAFHSMIIFNGTTCFNVLQDDSDVCSGNGTCLDWDTCFCKPGFSGVNCEFTSCSGINSTSPTVCSGHGECKYLNTCMCWEGQYVGNECQYEACFGKGSNDPQVCSGFGKCLSPNNCTCDPGYVGHNCQYVVCHGRNTSDSKVCSGNGLCYTPDNCLCYNNPAPGYTGGNCSAARCYSRFVDRLTGVESIIQYPESTLSLDVDLSLVCSRNGYCNTPNKCTCKTGYTDQYCSTPICFNITATNATACNYGKNGTCVAYDNCTCLTRFDSDGWCVPLKCFGKNSTTDPPACNNHLSRGNCLNVDLCACQKGYGGLECEQAICNNILEYNTSHVCNGRGTCDQPDICTCHLGYNGTDCQYVNCYGKLDVESAVCSGNGECIGPDSCECHEGYAGSKCELFICYDKLSNVSDVCSGFGKCVAPDTCECKYGYSGLECFYPSCFEVNSTETSVCTSQGVCYKPDKCNCTTGYVSRDCSVPTCFGIWGTNKTACSNNGFCVLPDVCECVPNRVGQECELNVCFGKNQTDEFVCSGNGRCVNPNQCKCSSEYTGADCSVPICHGIAASDNRVCSRNGICEKPDHCVCSEGRIGQRCELNLCYSYNETDVANVCSGNGNCYAYDKCNCSDGWASKDCSVPICSGVLATDRSVCSFNGRCVHPDTCNCTDKRTGLNCEQSVCFGFNQNDKSVCSSNGKCVSPDTCNCNSGRTGIQCEFNVCYGLNETDLNVCSGNGQCISPNRCNCKTEHHGWDCSNPVCFGTPSVNASVCSRSGQCVLPDTCVCSAGRTGLNCELNICSGRNETDVSVCSGHGRCVSPNICHCTDGYTGNDCQYPVCFGKLSTDSGVCSKSGVCTSPDNCVCHNGRTGISCQLNICFQVNETNEFVCNGNGVCNAPDHCLCNSNFTGFNCSVRVCQTGYAGQNCEIIICAGKLSNDSTVCNGHGSCISPDMCQCTDMYTGSNCEAIQDQCSGNFLLVSILDGKGNQNISLVDFACGRVAYTFSVPVSSQIIYHPSLKKYILFRSGALYTIDSAGKSPPLFLRSLSANVESSAIYTNDADFISIVSYEEHIKIYQVSLSKPSEDKTYTDRNFLSIPTYRDSRFITRDSLGNYFVFGQNTAEEICIVQIYPNGIFSVIARLPEMGNSVHALSYIGRRLYVATKSRFYFLLSSGSLAPEMDLLNGFITKNKVETNLNIYFNDPKSEYVMWSRRDRSLSNSYMMYPPSLKGKSFKIIGDFKPQLTSIDPPYLSTSKNQPVSLNGQFLQIGDFSTVTLYSTSSKFQVDVKLLDCDMFDLQGDVCFNPEFDWDQGAGEIELNVQINVLGSAFTTSVGSTSEEAGIIGGSGFTFTKYTPTVSRIYPTSATLGDTVKVYAPFFNVGGNVSCVFRYNDTSGNELMIVSDPIIVSRKTIDCLVPAFQNILPDDVVTITAQMEGDEYHRKYTPAFFHFTNTDKHLLYDSFDEETTFMDHFTISDNSYTQWISYQQESSRSFIQYFSTLTSESPRSSFVAKNVLLSRTDLHVSVGFMLLEGIGNLLELWLSSPTGAFVYGAVVRTNIGSKLQLVYKVGGIQGRHEQDCSIFDNQPYMLALKLVRPEIERMNDNLDAFVEMLKQNGTKNAPDEPWRIDVILKKQRHIQCTLSITPSVSAVVFNESIINSSIKVGQSLLDTSVRSIGQRTETLNVLLDRVWVGCQFEQYCNNTIIPKTWTQPENIVSYGKSVVVALSSGLGTLFFLMLLAVVVPIIIFFVWRYLRNLKKRKETAKLDAWKFEFVLDKSVSSLDDTSFSSVARKMYKVENGDENKLNNYLKKKALRHYQPNIMDYEMSDVITSSSGTKSDQRSDIPFVK